MSNHYLRLTALVIGLFVIFIGPAASLEPGLTVFVSIIPQQYFVERIGGDLVDVHVLVQPGHSPATFEPTPRQMAALSEAAVYFRIGVTFENALLPKIGRTMPQLNIVDTRRGITLRRMASRHEHEHHEEPYEKHGQDPHIWTSPKLVKLQALTITETLAGLLPAHQDVLEENYAVFAGELDVLDRHLAKALAPAKGQSFMVFHPSWGYFADAYGLRQRAIEIEGKNPSARHLAGIIEEARKEKIIIIFVQPQFSHRSAAAVAAAIGGTVVPIDPLAKDYLDNMRQVASQISKALEDR